MIRYDKSVANGESVNAFAVLLYLRFVLNGVIMFSVIIMEKINALNNKTYMFLGSSVTYGSSAGGNSMCEFLSERYGCKIIKNAVSGTTLAGPDADSYVSRLDAMIASREEFEKPDAFVCQLSTNDASHPEKLGNLTCGNGDLPDKNTCFGAVEYIITAVKRVWGCPIAFYTNSYFDNAVYAEMVSTLNGMKARYGIAVLDMYTDVRFNSISKKQRARYMSDDIHPTVEGYRDWWTPKFAEFLKDL